MKANLRNFFICSYVLFVNFESRFLKLQLYRKLKILFSPEFADIRRFKIFNNQLHLSAQICVICGK